MSRQFDLAEIPAVKQWLSEGGESVWDLLGTSGGTELAIAFSSLYWPELLEVEGCVLLRERYNPSNFRGWWDELDGDRSRIEGLINHVHLWDLCGCSEDEVSDEALQDLARILALTWRCALQHEFPDQTFDVRLVLDDPEEYGPTLSFSTVR